MTYYSASVESGAPATEDQMDAILECLADRGAAGSGGRHNTTAQFTVEARTLGEAVDRGITAARAAWRAAGATFRPVAVDVLTHAELARRNAR